MKLRLEIDRNGQEFFARIVHQNGRELFRSSETYKTKVSTRKAVDSLVEGMVSEDFEIVDLTKSVVSHKRK